MERNLTFPQMAPSPNVDKRNGGFPGFQEKGRPGRSAADYPTLPFTANPQHRRSGVRRPRAQKGDAAERSSFSGLFGILTLLRPGTDTPGMLFSC